MHGSSPSAFAEFQHGLAQLVARRVVIARERLLHLEARAVDVDLMEGRHARIGLQRLHGGQMPYPEICDDEQGEGDADETERAHGAVSRFRSGYLRVGTLKTPEQGTSRASNFAAVVFALFRRKLKLSGPQTLRAIGRVVPLLPRAGTPGTGNLRYRPSASAGGIARRRTSRRRPPRRIRRRRCNGRTRGGAYGCLWRST